MVAGGEVAVEAAEVASLVEVVVEEVGRGAVLAVLAELLDEVQHLQGAKMGKDVRTRMRDRAMQKRPPSSQSDHIKHPLSRNLKLHIV